MEAATPLRQPHVRVLGDVVAIDGLVVDDECAVRLVREREQNGDDPAKTVRDAVEIGARVLDREQAGANAEFVKVEFEKASRQVQQEFTEQARTIAQFFENQFAAVFGEQDGQLAKELERRFGDGSAASVQNRVREAVNETLAKSREDLVRQFSASDERNPLADFKASAVQQIHQAAARSDATQRALLEKMAELEKQMQALRLEKEKLEEVEAERERGTAKGRSFEEAVAAAVDEIALAQGDVAEAVGDLKEATGKVGDVVVAIDACNGPARGRIVIEAKDSRLSKPEGARGARPRHRGAERRLRRARRPHRGRGAAGEDGAAARVQRRQAGDGARPRGGARWRSRYAYRLARARVLMKRSDADGIDSDAVRATAERALAALTDERKIKNQLTGAKTASTRRTGSSTRCPRGSARCSQEIDALVRPAGEDDAAELPADQMEL